MATHLTSIPSQTASSVWGFGVGLVRESYTHLIRYYDRLSRYLHEVQEDEEMLQQWRTSYDSTQPSSGTSVAPLLSRKQVIQSVAARAGLRPDEVPYLALVGERVVRVKVQWEHGDGPLMTIHDLWWRLYRQLERPLMWRLDLGWRYVRRLGRDLARVIVGFILVVLVVILWAWLRYMK